MLRRVAHLISPDPRPDRPSDGDEAFKCLRTLLARLQENAPRAGLGAAHGHFIDHVAEVAERYGRNLFHCFDDDRIHSTSNKIEGFFGASKSQTRHALGTKRTTNGVAQNLGGDYLLAFARANSTSREDLLKSVEPLTPSDYEAARNRLNAAEKPARLRRSRKRFPSRHLKRLRDRWRATIERLKGSPR